MTAEPFAIECPDGATRALFDRADPARALGTLLVLAHGAGGHMEHRSTRALAERFAARGLDVLRFDFLYRVRGRGGPDRMPVLLATWRAVAAFARERCAPRRLLLGGQSMGGRAASLLVAGGELGEQRMREPCDGLVLLAYPLHPAGRPTELRDEHLPRIGVPALCLNGTRDSLCTRALMDAVVARLPASFAMRWIEGADHGFHVLASSGRTDEEVLDGVADEVTRFAAARG